ncbi:L-lysine 6-monooxygenase (NADPH-requiring)-domain-containing protein [Kockiozyma suomiensis]|uniref:L-lysine 6-monooxygenase (NADPH-requiring)-domain-containing protein n=1 Tax=Kockiozyma suomiensis TaxID=1337062 RepID=UPI003343FA88
MLSRSSSQQSFPASSASSRSSLSSLSTVGQDQLGSELHPYDFICVGFGPSALSIAIALADTAPHALDKVLFLEKQNRFMWHGGMLIPASRMQISFIKDFATQRDPTSPFTFLNFLHSRGRLIDFVNQANFYPLREEYQEYMSWCADHFSKQVVYNTNVLSVTPFAPKKKNDGESGGIRLLRVTSACSEDDVPGNENARTRYARNAIICTGGRPRFPECLKQLRTKYAYNTVRYVNTDQRQGLGTNAVLQSMIAHSSDFIYLIPYLQSRAAKKQSFKIGVLGSGQSAAEIVLHILAAFPDFVNVEMIFSSRALRPADDTPFVNEIFNPSAVDAIYSLPQAIRQRLICEDKDTNYGVVRAQLIEKLYEELYSQKLPGHRKRLTLLSSRTLKEASISDNGSVSLSLSNSISGEHTEAINESSERKEYDYLIAATGYDRTFENESLLSGLKKYMNTSNENYASFVTREYRLKLDERLVTAGVWIQGLCEDTHGLSDSLLSIMAIRGEIIADQIFPHKKGRSE